MGEAAGGAGEDDLVEAGGLGVDPPPGDAGAALGDADEEQRQPAQEDVGADAGFEAVGTGRSSRVDLRSRKPRSARRRRPALCLRQLTG